MRWILGAFLIPVAAGISLSCWIPVQAQVLFSGISSLEARASADGSVQILNFQTDVPFQYKKQVLNHDTIVLRLYNARLAQNLITPEGSINLLAGGAVQSARLKLANGTTGAGDSVQEIVLTGPGLGDRTLKVMGAVEMPSHPTVTATQHMMLARVATKKSSWQKKPAALPSFNNLRNLTANGAINGVIRDDNHPGSAPAVAYPAIAEAPRIEPEDPALPTVMKLSPGPRIEEVSSAQQNTTYTEASNGRDSLNAVDSSQNRVYAAGQEASSSVTTALPRYTGGAKPIEAMTTDNQGHPILIKPKSQPIPEFSVKNSGSGGYNTLFQAELEDPQQRIGRFLSDALVAYKANQFGVAQRQVQQALMLDANNADLLAALAEIQLKQGQTALAEQNYQKAQERALDKYGSRYAQLLTQQGKRKEAIQVLEALYRANPKQVQVAYMLGTLNEELGQTAQALTYLQQAAQLHPASADIQYNLGLAYELSGDREQAEKHYRQALSLTPKAPDILKALARVRQGGA